MKKAFLKVIPIFASMICHGADKQLSRYTLQRAPHVSTLSEMEDLVSRNFTAIANIEKLKKEESCCNTECSAGNYCFWSGLTCGCGFLSVAAATQCAGTLPPEYVTVFAFPAGLAMAAGLCAKEAIDRRKIRRQLEEHQASIESHAMSGTHLRKRKQYQIEESLV